VLKCKHFVNIRKSKVQIENFVPIREVEGSNKIKLKKLRIFVQKIIFAANREMRGQRTTHHQNHH